MKKVIALVLAGIMVLAFAACADKKGNDEETTKTEETTEAVDASTADILFAHFKDALDKNAQATDVELGKEILSDELLADMQGDAVEVEEGDLMGFNAPIKGFKSGAMYAPMISTIPFMGYVFTLNDAADADEFVKTLKENANLRWNICTEADEMKVEVVGDRVFFVMCPADMTDDGEDIPMDGEMPVEDFPMDDMPAADMEETLADIA